jgi:phage terminase large subunit
MEMLTIFSAITAIFMQITPTNIFFQNWTALHDPAIHTIVNEGGTSSSKTFSALQVLNRLCEKRTVPLLASIVSESLPHLRLGAMRDFKNILGDSYDHSAWHATEHIYTYRPDVQIEFFSADNPGKVHGPRRDILFLNEAINIPKNVCDNLIVRTRSKVIIDFNPTGEFWAHELKGKPGVAWIHSTYLDARDILPPEIIARIEAHKDTDPNWWNVYGLGLVGNVEGLVHPLFTQCEKMPESGDFEFYGLDFGYSNDVTSLTHHIIQGKDLYSDELIYETGLFASHIAKRMDDLGVRKGYAEIFADESRPEAIAEIALAGFNIQRCPKGPESVMLGIQKVNEYWQHWTKRSVNSIKEQRNYRYVTDKDGKITNKPIDAWNHSADSRRYGVMGKMLAMGNMPSVTTLSDEDLKEQTEQSEKEQTEYITTED